MHSFLRMFKSGFSSFIRNGWLSVASIIIMFFTLFLISAVFFFNVGISSAIKSVQDKIDISVYLKDDAKQVDVVRMQKDLANLDDVRSIKYISKADALKKFKEQNKNNKELLESVDSIGNSLPASLAIKTYNPDKLDNINTILSNAKYKATIDKISYQDNKKAIQNLMQITNATKTAGIIATLFLTFVSLIIIFNTIRIAIFSRMEEIEIMKLVGATPGFIKGPFLIEGAIYGLIATIISISAMSFLLYVWLAPTVMSYFSDAGGSINNYLRDNLVLIALVELLTGLIIGIFSSWLAIRKHLKLG